MRSVIGLALLSGLALTGVERLTAPGRATEPARLASGAAATSVAKSSMFTTVAESDAPTVSVAPGAPRAAAIAPIVAPVKKTVTPATTTAPVAKPTAVTPRAKTKLATTAKPEVVTNGRPDFKLTCTAEQKLDTVKKRCIPLKGTAVAKL